MIRFKLIVKRGFVVSKEFHIESDHCTYKCIMKPSLEFEIFGTDVSYCSVLYSKNFQIKIVLFSIQILNGLSSKN